MTRISPTKRAATKAAALAANAKSAPAAYSTANTVDETANIDDEKTAISQSPTLSVSIAQSINEEGPKVPVQWVEQIHLGNWQDNEPAEPVIKKKKKNKNKRKKNKNKAKKANLKETQKSEPLAGEVQVNKTR
jgi:hypothetical protein